MKKHSENQCRAAAFQFLIAEAFKRTGVTLTPETVKSNHGGEGDQKWVESYATIQVPAFLCGPATAFIKGLECSIHVCVSNETASMVVEWTMTLPGGSRQGVQETFTRLGFTERFDDLCELTPVTDS